MFRFSTGFNKIVINFLPPFSYGQYGFSEKAIMGAVKKGLASLIDDEWKHRRLNGTKTYRKSEC